MKALIRHAGETVLEGFVGIDWNTGAPLTDPAWAGGAYTLVQNYIPPKDDEEIIIEPEQVEVEEEIEDEDDYVIIDGKRYSKAELRSLLE